MEKLTMEQAVEALGNMSVMQVIALTRDLEKLWNVKAEPLVVALPPGNNEPPPQAQTEFTVMLISVPSDKKMSVIKVVRDLVKLGLKESKDLVEAAPKSIKEGVDAAEAESLRLQLTAAGAVVEVK